MKTSRRHLLKVGLGGAGLLAVGGLGLSMQSSVLREPGRALLVLDTLEYSVLSAVAERICPAGDGFPSAASLDVAAGIDAFVSLLDPAAGAELKSLLRLLENGVAGLLLDGRPRPFTACSPEVQDATLHAWQHSRIGLRRSGMKVLRGFCSSTYYSDPRVYSHVGYPGPPDFSSFEPPPPAPVEPAEEASLEGSG